MAKKKPPLLGPGYRKIQPRLRMVANCRPEVSEVRADFDPAVRMAPTYKVAEVQPPSQHLPQIAVSARAAKLPAPKKKLPALSEDVRVSIFVERSGTPSMSMKQAVSAANSSKITSVRGRFATMEVPVSELPSIATQKDIVRIEMGESLKHPRPATSTDRVPAPAPTQRKFRSNGGKNVLIGIIDVDGFDFAHPDFLDNGQTRFVSIWDQGGVHRPKPNDFDFGSEITQAHMNAAIKASSQAGIAPQMLEPQSSMLHASHGTHVASIAAGNRGVCRNAFLTAVLIDLPKADNDRRKSFYDSTRIAHAVEYILQVGERLKAEHHLDSLPVSINISLGTNGHAHDGSSAICRWLEHVLTTPGRNVTVAAGNAGQEAAEYPDDFGYVMGRIHSSGRIAARGLVNELDWVVVGNGTIDVSENELEIWYSASDRFGISIKPPGGAWIGPVLPGQFIENRQLPDKSFVSIYNERYHPANGANYIGVYLTPHLSTAQIVGITPGLWKVRLHGIEVRDGRYHGWIERDDPAELGPVGMAAAWRFPSFFTEATNVDSSSVSSLGCGEQVLSVANLDEVRQKINISSSQGPTRDDRLKPDVAAPGTDVVAALGFNFDDSQKWIGMTGTSMASPFVCGVVGLMLAENPLLTAAQIRGILQRTAKPLPNADFKWRNDAGYGVIDPKEALEEARRHGNVEDLT